MFLMYSSTLTNDNSLTNAKHICSFIVIPQIMYNTLHATADADSVSPDFRVADLFTAKGFMAESIVFYGAYSPQTLNMTAGHHYSLPHAYFLTTTLLFLITFLVVSIM